jgi:flagellar FliL protein
MAKPAAASEVEVEVKPKKPIVKIILALFGLVFLISGTMVGTLFIAGFFSKPPPSLDQVATEEANHGKPGAEASAGGKTEAAPAKHGADASSGKKPDAAPAKPGAEGAKASGEAPKLNKKSPNSPRFEYTYHQMAKEFLVNISGSRKVMSVQFAIMTRYDERVIENVKKHEFAIRSVVMDVMRQTNEADITKPDFRKDLAVKIRDAMNSLIEKFEDFGGIEDVYFTSFIVQ